MCLLIDEMTPTHADRPPWLEAGPFSREGSFLLDGSG